MTHQEQLEQWVFGNSVHNPTTKECCPDFSCCRPELKVSPEKRLAFLEASEGERHTMLVGFLGALLKAHGHSVKTSRLRRARR